MKALPEGYALRATVEPSKSAIATIGTALLGFAFLVAFGWFFFRVAALIRRGDLLSMTGEGPLITVSRMQGQGTNVTLHPATPWILGGLGALLLMPVLHELTHGLCFRLVTRERPVYAWKQLSAYASAPAWYLPRKLYLIVELAPLVLISLLALALLPIVPTVLLPGVLFVAIFNAASAVADILVVVWLLMQPRGTLVHDIGPSFETYAPVA